MTAALALLLLSLPLHAVDTKSVTDMTPDELEHYLGKGKQSQLAPIIGEAMDLKNKSAGARAVELYGRLRSLKPVDVIEVPALISTLDDPTACPNIRKSTPDDHDPAHCPAALINALASIGPPAAAAAGSLIRLLPDPALGCAAAQALGKIQPVSPSPVPALSASLRAGNACAIEALGDLGPAAKGAVPMLAAILNDASSPHRERAADALAKIGTPGTRAAIDKFKKEGAVVSTTAAAADTDRAKNWLKSRPWSAKWLLTSALRCKLAEDKLALSAKAKDTAAHDAAFASGQKTCLAFSDDYAQYAKAFAGEALPFLWSYCGENHDKKLCAAMRNWIETHQ